MTGWCVLALKSAELAGFRIPPQVYAGPRAWLDKVTDEFGIAGYNARYTGQVVTQGKNENYENHEAMTAIGITCRIALDRRRDAPHLAVSAAQLMLDLPAWDDRRIDFYYWFHGSLALFQFDGPDGPCWSTWRRLTARALMDHQQNIESHWDGSWDPIARWGYEGGRVYATAINVLTLKADALFPLFAAGSPLPRPATFAPDPLTEEQKRVVRDVVDGARMKARGAGREIYVMLPGSKSPAKRIAALDTAPREEAMKILEHLSQNNPQAAIRAEARAIIEDVARHLKARLRAEAIRACIRDLGSEQAVTRDQASQKLMVFGDEAIEPLREAAAGPANDPMRPHVMAVLTQLAKTTPDLEDTVAILGRTKIDVDLNGRPLRELVDILHRATGLSFHIDDSVASRDVKITIRVRGLSVRSLLKLALTHVSLGYVYEDKGIRICELSELR